MTSVLLVEQIDLSGLANLLLTYGLKIEQVGDGLDIPGSYWGNPEAGLIQDVLYVRGDTPVHSALHEACHWICMDEKRRRALHTDAGGTILEECAVNYLQIVLAGELPDVGITRMLDDMDAWGYSYREGKVRNWLKGDAEDALNWLLAKSILGPDMAIMKEV